MAHIKVWCEYDFGGQFGSNNEEVFEVMDDLTDSTVDEIVLSVLSNCCDVPLEELEDLYGWKYIAVELLD